MNKLPAILAALRATAPAQPNIVFLLAAAPAESKMLAAQPPDLVKQLSAKWKPGSPRSRRNISRPQTSRTEFFPAR